MCENNLANTYAELNDFRKAEKFYAQALDTRARSENACDRSGNRSEHGKSGDVSRKVRATRCDFWKFRAKNMKNLKMPHQTAIAELEIADIYLELNLAKEAFEIYEKVADKLQKLKLQGEEARARANFGRAAAFCTKPEIARNELKKSARLYLAEKNKVGAAAVKLTEANLELDSRNFTKRL